MKNLLIAIVAVVSLAAAPARCLRPAQSQTTNTFLSATEVKYGGVSLRFDKALADEIKAETVPAALEGKPSDLWPEHVAFKLVNYPQQRSLPSDSPQLRVFSVQRFRDAVE